MKLLTIHARHNPHSLCKALLVINTMIFDERGCASGRVGAATSERCPERLWALGPRL